MAVENHPKWPQWNEALEEMIAAKKAMEEHPHNAKCKAAYGEAEFKYWKIADELRQGAFLAPGFKAASI